MTDIKIIDASDIDFDHENKKELGIIRTIRYIKIKQDIYYGPKNANKNKFMRMYKKLGLSWRTEKIDGIDVDGWFNKDKSQYIIKLVEAGDYKRFKFYGCDEIYDYFISLGAITFDPDKENIKNTNVMKNDYKFVGADLWSHYRTEQLLKDVPENWGVKWV